MSKTSGPDSSSLAWKIVLGGCAVVAAVGAFFVVRSHFSQNEKAPKKVKAKAKSNKKKPVKAKSLVPSSSSKKEAQPVSDLELLDKILTSMEVLQQRAEPDGSDEQKLLKVLKELSPTTYTSKTRLAAAQWLILYHTIKTISSQTPEEYKACAAQQHIDMQLAWIYLDTDSSSEHERQALDLLRLDVGQRLKDATKMAPVFDRVYNREDITYEETVVAFTTAPLLGKWKATRELGARIVERQNGLDDFHKAAQHRPDIPDYSVLYDLALEESKRGDTDISQLKWFSAKMTDLQIRLKEVRCEDESKKDEMEANFDPAGSRDWKNLTTSEHRLHRFGGIAQMVSLSTVPIPIVGPADDNRLNLSGNAELPMPDQSGSVLQKEDYLLQRQPNSNFWSGEYTLVQDPRSQVSSLAPVKVEVVFDIKMRILEVDDI